MRLAERGEAGVGRPGVVSKPAIFLGVGRDPVDAGRILECEVVRERTEGPMARIAIGNCLRRRIVAAVIGACLNDPRACEQAKNADQTEKSFCHSTPTSCLPEAMSIAGSACSPPGD